MINDSGGIPKPLAHSQNCVQTTVTTRTARHRPKNYALAIVLVSATALSACGPSASNNGAKSCVLVGQALTLLKKTPPKMVAAQELLRQALPLASIAAGTNGNWQPLEATLSETDRVPIQILEPALSAECSSTGKGNPNSSGVFQQANIPGNKSSN